MFRNVLRYGFVALVLSGVSLSSVAGYKGGTVDNGGSISGKISFSGAANNPALDITKDTDFCGAGIKGDYIVVDGSGGLKYAVVAIEKITSGKKYDKKAIIPFDNKKCMFSPHVATAVKKQKLGINNSDPILHNTHFYHGPRERTMYNIALPLQNRVIKKKMKKSGVVTVKCDAHEWMLGYVYVTDHPYAIVTAADGSFELTDVPAGDYQIKIWHEKLGETTQSVTVPAGGNATLNHSF